MTLFSGIVGNLFPPKDSKHHYLRYLFLIAQDVDVVRAINRFAFFINSQEADCSFMKIYF